MHPRPPNGLDRLSVESCANFPSMNFLSRLFTRDQRSQTEQLIDAVESRYALSVRADSIDTESRTAVAVAATEGRVPVFDFERFEVVEEILVAEGGSFPERMPLLDSHNRGSVFNVLGSATNPVRKGSEWELRMEFDDDEDSIRAFKKVQKRHIQDVSIGYNVTRAEFIEPGQTKTVAGRSFTAGERTLKVAYEWVGKELSPTPIGADRQAKIRSLVALHGRQMKQPSTCGNLAAELKDTIDELGGQRSEFIADMANASGISESQVESILDGNADGLTRSQLDGFSYALDADVGQLIEAASEDGFKYE